VDSDARLNNITTNSACFSPITADEATWLTAVFRYDRAEKIMKLVPGSLGQAHNWNSENYQDMFSWSENLFADTFM
jgi:sulfide dehydrogenase [flavocytochrome c] flavoprotein subunit